MISRSLLLLPIFILSLSFTACDSGGVPDFALDKGAIVPDFRLPDVEGKMIDFKKDMGRGNTYLLF